VKRTLKRESKVLETVRREPLTGYQCVGRKTNILLVVFLIGF